MEKQKHIIFQGKLALGIMFLMLEFAASLPIQDRKEDNAFKMIGCLPCSQKFLVSSYFDKENSLDDLSFEKFLINDLLSLNSCPSLRQNLGNIFELSFVHRQLIGEGSHRHLFTSMVYEVGNAFSRLNADFCRAVIIERLPAGIFADPFELQHLVQHGAFLDAAVFGDTNLELPSALSNRTVVEIHMNIQHSTSSVNSKGLEFTVKLPLHARYPPLDVGGYSRVAMGQPDLLIYCRPKSHSEDCYSSIIYWNVNYSHDNITWWIPCGNEHHARVISVITFLSALVSSLLIVYFSISSCPQKKGVKLA